MTEKEGLAKLRAPFEPHQISILPKPLKKVDRGDPKYQCKPGTQASADNKYCGGYHTRSIHLDYVGHAALTDRLLEVDPDWSWEPVAYDDKGLPAFDNNGGLWIRLTICGITRLGYGDAPGKNGGLAVKEAIGDALRNAGMRFGAALDLWHKGDLHDAKEEQGNLEPAQEPTPPTTIQRPKFDKAHWEQRIAECPDKDALRELWDEAKGQPKQVFDMITQASKAKDAA